MKRMLAEFEKIQAILMAFPHEFGGLSNTAGSIACI